MKALHLPLPLVGGGVSFGGGASVSIFSSEAGVGVLSSSLESLLFCVFVEALSAFVSDLALLSGFALVSGFVLMSSLAVLFSGLAA